ncbi:MAG: patatin-like protein [Variovorax sp.]
MNVDDEPPSDQPPRDYGAEIRFGIVMYGGVSLAIYINGVSNELYEMARATPRGGLSPRAKSLAATSDVYRRLAWLIADGRLVQLYARALAQRDAARPADQDESDELPEDVWSDRWLIDRQPTRFAIDVVAGTSAGGINGIFLGKALVNAEPYSLLRDLWINEGDFALLLHDEASYAGLDSAAEPRWKAPESLLNSDRMYLKLRDAMAEMSAAVTPPAEKAESPYVEELDVFVTTTDIRGTRVPLRLYDKVVYELRHKQSFHFAYRPGDTLASSDFQTEHNPFLAFAARCTSSFPFAFEPMTLQAMFRLQPSGAGQDPGRWRQFFPGLRAIGNESDKEVWERQHSRAFGDGGYLDNKPFSYVVEALSARQAATPVERKLIYIEPAPQAFDEMEGKKGAMKAAKPTAEKPGDTPPDALSNSMAALVGIPRYETIREDLQAVLHRNRRIERIERLVQYSEATVEAATDPSAEEAGSAQPRRRWSEMRCSDLIAHNGIAFLPYWRLRILSVTDKLADNLAARWGIDQDSDHLYALRAIVRAWRDQRFAEEGEPDTKQPTSAFLDQFDLDFRIRRLGFTLRKIDQVVRLLQKRLRLPKNEDPGKWCEGDELSESDRNLVKRLRLYGLDLCLERDEDRSMRKQAVVALGGLKRELRTVLTKLRMQERHHRNPCEGPAAPTPDEREELQALLTFLLNADPAADRQCRLRLFKGGVVPVKLTAVHMPSATRTLQETVFLRAEQLMDEAARTGLTQLQARLEEGVEGMRVKRAPVHLQATDAERAAATQAEPLPADAASARAWQLLGTSGAGHVRDLEGKTAVPDLAVTGDPQLDSTIGRLVRGFMSSYYLRYDHYDQISFPVYYDTGTGEPATVQIVRVSPQDATGLVDEGASGASGRRKLAGTALMNFGAFLEKRWRRNDILWGRLDGAERLVHALLPAVDESTKAVRRELIDRAHGMILSEALLPHGHNNLAELLCEALDELPDENLPDRLRTLFDRLKLGDGARQEKLRTLLASLLGPQGLIRYMRSKPDLDPNPDPKAALANAARAVKVTGRVLEGISQRRGAGQTTVRWVARIGLIFQGLFALSVPGSLSLLVFRHWIKVLYGFEIFLLVGSIFLALDGVRSFAMTALAVTVVVHLASLVATDAMQSKRRYLRLVGGVTGAAILALALFGVLTLGQIGFGESGAPLCARRTSSVSAWPWSRLCADPPPRPVAP